MNLLFITKRILQAQMGLVYNQIYFTGSDGSLVYNQMNNTGLDESSL